MGRKVIENGEAFEMGEAKKKKTKKISDRGRKAPSASAKYPRHSIDKALRIPKAILDQNAGKECTVEESAKFVGVGFHGPYQVEVSSGIKYGLLIRPSDPFWGSKLIDKIAENILSAIKTPEEAIFKTPQ
jgi:hypothetical protein